MELAHRLDDARPADAGDADGLDGFLEARLVRPQLAADDLDARHQGVAVDPHPLDGARRRALPVRDLRPLERGSGGARRGDEPVPGAEHDLGVGADVDHERHLVAEVRALGEDDPGGVRAHVPRDARQEVRAGAGVDVHPEVPRLHRHAAVDHERERLHAELGGVDAEHEVVHGRVAHQGRLDDVLAVESPPPSPPCLRAPGSRPAPRR